MPLFSLAQDVIILKDGSEIKAKVTEVGVDEIKYRKAESGPIYITRKKEINSITYADGTNEVITVVKSDKDTIPNAYMLGVSDADKYYNCNNCGSFGVGASAVLLGPMFGLIPTVMVSSTPPSSVNLVIRKKEMMNNQEYMKGYREEAYRIKKSRVWTAYGTGIAIEFAAFLILLFSALH